ncbi:hypothetical protein [Morganella morganii]|uniref:hypothetical protein n=1 Tax=Morganella morganii TaxID=582 RepID=UPI00182A4F6D|nr:hypothetical protein [Morganella morganii]HAG7874997.1 hypothetical protein [Escherichia coli]EKT0593840.1 hypothetical protein [Morganella morganii]EKU0271652.1 hypothetical protein [Morganella morganii]ELF0885786.1 hypothetical protein [Morganella morganii]MBT0390179.1 hypothetical protein [Morganella morganii subsp. morganii]
MGIAVLLTVIMLALLLILFCVAAIQYRTNKTDICFLILLLSGTGSVAVLGYLLYMLHLARIF